MNPLAPLLALALATLATASAQSPSPSPSPAAKPDLLGLGDLGADRPAGSRTEITAQKEATFDEKSNTAVFLGSVRINDPAFLLSADKLTVHLGKDRSGIDRAIAEGNVVIVQQGGPDVKDPATGRARRAEYVPAEGRVTLSGNPEIQQGINRHIATSPSTRMVLLRDGRATTEGPSRTVITDQSAAKLP